MVGVIFPIVFTFYYFLLFDCLLVDICIVFVILFLFLFYFSISFTLTLQILFDLVLHLLFISYLCYCIYYQFISLSRVIP